METNLSEIKLPRSIKNIKLYNKMKDFKFLEPLENIEELDDMLGRDITNISEIKFPENIKTRKIYLPVFIVDPEKYFLHLNRNLKKIKEEYFSIY